MEIPINRQIHELPKQVADKIAAGEVVDRPVSIVKELVENAIDAGSTSITVEIKNGGKTYLRVTDNGCGIQRDQAELAFKRHATSKIEKASDLDRISTLGFRGEALASIAAVSRAELITKTGESSSGYKLRIEGGEYVEKSDTGCPDGTTLVISDLFYNTPARMKFLKPDNTESTLIIDFMSKMALAYPLIKMRLINNGTILFSTPGKGDIHTNILTIYSREIGEKLIRAEKEGDGMRLIAYVSPPSQSKTNRKSQIFFINGRSVVSKVLEHAVADAYAEKLFDGRYPIAFLFLSVSPERLDVNIHPNKKEVRFDNEKSVRLFVGEAVREALFSREALPEIRQENLFKQKDWSDESVPQKKEDDIKSFLSTRPREREKEADAFVVAEKGAAYICSDGSAAAADPHSKGSAAGSSAPISAGAGASADGLRPISAGAGASADGLRPISAGAGASADGQTAFNAPEPVDEQSAPLFPLPPPERIPFDINALKPAGAIFNTYITAVDDDSFYLIDQHAAHERIFYEQLMEAYNREESHSQMLLTSFVVELPFAVKNNAADFLFYLKKIGYHIEEFGVKAYIVKEIPAMMELSEAEDFLEYFLDNISADFSLRDPAKVNKIIMKSCKSAVKANDHLDIQEINALMKSLAATKNPFSCPHGRPTFIKLSKYEIEKLFKRV